MHTPVAMLVFNRPEPTRRVFERVRQARPPVLLVVADGPRPNRQGESERCAQVRAIFDQIDWPCDLRPNFADRNLGCRNRVSSGLDWVFREVEEAIILEDDCLPEPTFFPFCEELLGRYRLESRVHALCGSNFQAGRRRGPASYFAARLAHIWGWASWRRAWSTYDVTMRDWPAFRDGGRMLDALGNPDMARYYANVFDATMSGGINTWDYQWIFAGLKTNALTLFPQVNLVTNIGFASDSTHLAAAAVHLSIPARPMPFPLVHPERVEADLDADEFHYHRWVQPPIHLRGWRKFKRIVRRITPAVSDKA